MVMPAMSGSKSATKSKNDKHLSTINYRIVRRPKSLPKISENAFDWDRMIEHRKSSIRCKVEHPFHYLKNKFGFKKVRYRGIAKNLNKLNILFACINLMMRDYALKHSVQPME